MNHFSQKSAYFHGIKNHTPKNESYINPKEIQKD